MTTYYLDTLPVHPQPAYMETLTSYLTRIAQANSIRSIGGLSQIVFSPIDMTYQLKDNPLSSFDSIEKLTNNSKDVIRNTTFYNMIRVFGYHKNIPHQFFLKSIADYLRYCPICLSENLYYILPWRFHWLSVCPNHSCQILDRCGHCGSRVSLFVSPFRIGVCQSCKSDLRKCLVDTVSGRECEVAIQRFEDLKLLLSPQPILKSNKPITQQIGQQLSLRRQAKNFTRFQIASFLKMPMQDIAAIELGYIKPNVTPFYFYTTYADFLEITFRDIYDYMLRENNFDDCNIDFEKLSIAIKAENYTREDMLLDAVRKIYQQTIDSNFACTTKVIRNVLDLPVEYLWSFPRVKALLSEIHKKNPVKKRKSKEEQKAESLEIAEIISSM